MQEEFSNGTSVGSYTIERLVGRGAMGVVYRASNLGGSEFFAVKILSLHAMGNKLVQDLFVEEAQAGLQLDHTHIVKTIYFGEHEGRPYIVLEFINGFPLADLIKKGPLPESQCIWVMRQMGQALRYMQKKNILHQDVKPENILIDATGTCKLSDMSFARLPGTRINWSVLQAGTSLYMPPEQWLAGKGGGPIDAHTDLYSLGASIYHAATGDPPFKFHDEQDLRYQHLNVRPEAANVRIRGLSMEFAKILAKLLEKNPRDRYTNAEELLHAMRALTVPQQPPVVSVSRVVAHKSARK